MSSYKILLLGATGMLGNAIITKFVRDWANFDIYGTVRTAQSKELLPQELHSKLIDGVDALDLKSVENSFKMTKPDVAINCIGVIKQLDEANDSSIVTPINAIFPHQLSELCKKFGARLIHISTDCVFDGKKGNYTEENTPNAEDLYGKTKYFGEVIQPNAITIRTSIIGHELKGNYGLVDWFLSQEGKVRGFTNAIYTGFPTVVMARIIAENVIPRPEINGLYHVSSSPISKYDLLKLVARAYNKNITIEPYDDFKCDRSLNSDRFRKDFSYTPPVWEDMIKEMFENSR